MKLYSFLVLVIDLFSFETGAHLNLPDAMKVPTSIVPALLATGAAASPVVAPETTVNTTIPNANHIFNAIHSSMRQWGSSVNHNGMSFFIATVPAGTEFYHGRSDKDDVKGMEWLAFEPEHALLFARPRRGGPPGGGPGRGPPGHGPPGGGPPGHGDGDRRGPPPWESGPKPADDGQKPIHGKDQRGEEDVHGEDVTDAGFLHTYAAKRDLRLLYLDGEAAGKSDKGTLDSQDYVLVDNSDGHLGFGEYTRGEEMCNLAKKEWKDNIDGILRMEGGFEIILCDFQRDLDTLRITRAQAKDNEERGGGMAGGEEDGFAYYQAVAARYHGIGGDRVTVDYENFVTAFAYPEFDLFQENTSMPRLKNLSENALTLLRNDVTTLAKGKRVDLGRTINWQLVVDQVVNRFGQRLGYINTGKFDSKKKLQDELLRILRPYIDFENRDTLAETERCASQFMPAKFDPSTVAARAVTAVTHKICSTMLAAADDSLSYEQADALVKELVQYLSWTTWKECTGCTADEICIVPIWPLGAVEDMENPRCVNATTIQGRHGYWGGFGPREVEVKDEL